MLRRKPERQQEAILGVARSRGRRVSGNLCEDSKSLSFFFFFFHFLIYFNWRLITILWWFLPYIHMNQPWVYMCSPSWTSLPPPSPFHLSASSQCTSREHPVSCTEPGLGIYFTYDNMHVSMLFCEIIPPSPSPTESKSLFFTSVSFSARVFQSPHCRDVIFTFVLMGCLSVL